MTVVLFPKKSDYLSTRVYDTINLAIEHVPELKGAYAYKIREAYKDLSDEEVIEKIHAKFKDKVDYSKIEKEYNRRLEGLSLEQPKAIGIGFVMWLIPTLVVYLLGWGVGWVIRGFTQR